MADEEMTKEELSRFGRYMAGFRRIIEGQCEICGKSFKGTTKRRYCGNTCAARAYRRKHKAASTQEQSAG